MEASAEELADIRTQRSLPYRILLVDDIPEIRLLVRARLASLVDLDVVGEASNGREGVSLVRALAPDLVILDLEMPVMTGEQAIPLMREIEPGMPILLYTATPAKAGDFLPRPLLTRSSRRASPSTG